MANQEHIELLLNGVDAWNSVRVRGEINAPDQSGAILNGAKLDGADLGGVDLSNADLFGTKLKKTLFVVQICLTLFLVRPACVKRI